MVLQSTKPVKCIFHWLPLVSETSTKGYYSQYLRQMASSQPVMVDFRCVRFPGLISAVTVPTGGTSDFAPEMLHAAAQGQNYLCWAREDTRIPFMAMPDAARAMLQLALAPKTALSRRVYNVTSFSPSAQEFATLVQEAFADCQVTFQPDNKRQAILDSWPADVDDSAARKDWGWMPEYSLSEAFQLYLLPAIKARYR
jgi:nucleoside-diphosphate-sugar epimerase